MLPIVFLNLMGYRPMLLFRLRLVSWKNFFRELEIAQGSSVSHRDADLRCYQQFRTWSQPLGENYFLWIKVTHVHLKVDNSATKYLQWAYDWGYQTVPDTRKGTPHNKNGAQLSCLPMILQSIGASLRKWCFACDKDFQAEDYVYMCLVTSSMYMNRGTEI